MNQLIIDPTLTHPAHTHACWGTTESCQGERVDRGRILSILLLLVPQCVGHRQTHTLTHSVTSPLWCHYHIAGPQNGRLASLSTPWTRCTSLPLVDNTFIQCYSCWHIRVGCWWISRQSRCSQGLSPFPAFNLVKCWVKNHLIGSFF